MATSKRQQLERAVTRWIDATDNLKEDEALSTAGSVLALASFARKDGFPATAAWLEVASGYLRAMHVGPKCEQASLRLHLRATLCTALARASQERIVRP
jgi:hypothetical protein